jgi:hypothetical protein
MPIFEGRGRSLIGGQIVSEVFGLSFVVLSEDQQGTVESFGNSILDRNTGPTDDIEAQINGHDLMVRSGS